MTATAELGSTLDRVESSLIGWKYYQERHGRTNKWHPKDGQGIWLDGREWSTFQEPSGTWILLRNEGWGAMGSEFKMTIFWRDDGIPTENKDSATRYSSLDPLVKSEQ